MNVSKTIEPVAGTDEPYVIRPYESGDAAGVARLYETVWGSEKDAAWLTYKFETNPYVDGTATLVTELDGEIVGVRPSVPIPMRLGHTDLIGVYLVSLMVHPDHRRRGVFTQMMEFAKEYYADAGSDVCFNYANELSAPGYRKLEFTELGSGPGRHLRVQRPGDLAADRVPEPLDGPARIASNTAARAYLAARRARRERPRQYAISRDDGIRESSLVTLYDAATMDGLHTRREPEFYRWLEANPSWTYETYVASDADGTDTAALLVKRQTDGDSTRVRIADAVPAVSEINRDAFQALLAAVLSDNADAEIVSTSGLIHYERLLPDDLLTGFDFHSDASPLMNWFTHPPDTMFAFALGDTHERVTDTEGVDLLAPETWRLELR